MDPRFVDDLKHEAHALSEEAMPLLVQQSVSRDRKTPAGLRRTAAQTRLTTLLMDAVAWLAFLGPGSTWSRPAGLGRPRLGTRVDARDRDQLHDLDPALRNLLERALRLHERLERIAQDVELAAAEVDADRLGDGAVDRRPSLKVHANS